ncbi:MAG TPA: virulence RhuM family protein [Candidatus Sutterella merdavium]|nr:virulence RhuM family protein [Candidatus Sutterella merdavium]
MIAKNYLSKTELDTLNRLVSMYLDVAELRAKKGIPTTMEDWEKSAICVSNAGIRVRCQNGRASTGRATLSA